MMDGLAKVDGDETLYHRLLSKFFEKYNHYEEEVGTLRKQEKPDEFLRAVHNLKANAGQIGAKELACVARALESAIREGDTAESIDGLFRQSCIELAPIIGGLAVLSGESLLEKETYEITKDRDILHQLKQMLLDFDAEASGLVETLRIDTNDPIVFASFFGMKKATVEYDFAAALRHLEELLEALSSLDS
jgi:HPt (histidine-containing phosphotransfer) domain-containing protein